MDKETYDRLQENGITPFRAFNPYANPRFFVRMVKAELRLSGTTTIDCVQAAVSLMAEDYCWRPSQCHEIGRRARAAEETEWQITRLEFYARKSARSFL